MTVTIDQAVDNARQQHVGRISRGGSEAPDELFQKCVEIVAERLADETLDDPVKHELYETIDITDLMPVFTFLHRAHKGGDAGLCAEIALNHFYDDLREKLIDYYTNNKFACGETQSAAEQMALDIESGHTDIDYERCRVLRRERAMEAA